jgi:hypothetical protein
MILQRVRNLQSLSCRSRPQLNAMPLCNLILQHLVDQLMLLDHSQALELGRLNLDRIHRSAAAADVLDLGSGSAWHSHNSLRTMLDATVAGVVSALQQSRHAVLVVPLTRVPSLTTDIAVVASTLG